MNPISYNTYLKFYRIIKKTEEEAKAAARVEMQRQHKFIRGKKHE